MVHDVGRSVVRLLLPLFLLLAGCTAHYPVNDPMLQVDTTSGYRAELTQGKADRADGLLVMLAFSGGGTRAAAFSYGVLEAFRDITINWEGSDRRLLSEVDSISAVSGGSFTAAYFGLFGDRIFEDYSDKFLYADVQSHLTWSLFKPWNWVRFGSRHYGRSEYAAGYYDKILFEGTTFADLLKQDGPVIQINATEVATGSQFTFRQAIFDGLCSDLSTFPISRAVAASSAVPVLFSSITINNYAGSCNFEVSAAALQALSDPDPTSRRRHLARQYIQYLDREARPFLHLYDGGLSDNLGVRANLNRLELGPGAWQTATRTGQKNLRRLLFVVVNAQVESKTAYSQRASAVPLFDTILGSTSIPMNELSFDSLVAVKTALAAFANQYVAGRCAELEETGEDASNCADFKTHLVTVDLDQLADAETRRRLKLLPTSFVLKAEQVDDLRDAAREVLLSSPDFQHFLDDMQ
jgi:NTE family protein